MTISEWQLSNITEFTTDPNAGFNPLGNSLPVLLTPGSKRSMLMNFSTAVQGQYTNELDITSNDPDSKHTIAVFTGTAELWNKCDFDMDGDVDFCDFAAMAQNWLLKPGTHVGDVVPLTPDGRVNILDLDYFAKQWLLKKNTY